MGWLVGAGLWEERPFGRTGRRLVLALVGLSLVVDLALLVTSDGAATSPQVQVFETLLALVVALFAWRPSVAALALLAMLPLAVVVDDLPVMRLALPAVTGLVVATCGRAMVVLWVAVAFGGIVLSELVRPDTSLVVIAFALVVGAASGALGVVGRRAGVREDALRSTVAAQERALAEVRRIEQERIADELHDGIARQLTVIAIQAKVLGRTDDAEVRRMSQSAIADSAARALADVRRVLEMGGGGADDARQERQVEDWDEAVADVVTTLRARGTTVETRLDGVAVPPGVVSSTLARVLREAAHNVGTHAPGAARVRIALAREGDDVALTVGNDVARGGAAGAPHSELSGGYGIVRLTERVRALGGSLEAGPSDEVGAGGWAVRARVPVG